MFRGLNINPNLPMKHKEIVEIIKNLSWKKLSAQELQQLMFLSYVAAREFAGSLRIAQDLNPGAFAEMAKGELLTSNLAFEDYSGMGDHADFLWHFLKKYQLLENIPQSVQDSAGKYLLAIESLPKQVRAESIVSRERELSGIFSKILENPDWSLLGLAAFKYYLQEHIRLDSMPGGHADLLEKFEVTDNTSSFYEIRLGMYRCIPTLFPI